MIWWSLKIKLLHLSNKGQSYNYKNAYAKRPYSTYDTNVKNRFWV